MSTCRVEGCKNQQEARGICVGHLRSIGQQINEGQGTWKHYEDAGICIPIPIRNKDKLGLCLTDGCPARHRSRGLCDNCYAAAVRVMKQNKFLWEDLEKLGLSRPANRRKSIKQSLFMINARKAIANTKEKLGIPITVPPPEQTILVTQDQPIIRDSVIEKAREGKLPIPLKPSQQPKVTFPPFAISPIENSKNITLQGVPIKYVQNLNMPEQPMTPAEQRIREAEAVSVSVKPEQQPENIIPPFIVSTGRTQEVVIIDEHAQLPPSDCLNVDLSRVNASEPESEPDESEIESQSFPAQPTQIPGQEGGQV